MVVHVGIDAKKGVAAVYNGVTEIKQRFKVSRSKGHKTKLGDSCNIVMVLNICKNRRNPKLCSVAQKPSVLTAALQLNERNPFKKLNELKGYFLYDDDDVDDMFKELKAKIGEEELLGFCCVSLKSKHKNEVRKKIIKTGKEIGFKRIQIISCESAVIIELISKMGNKFETNDVIWFLCDESCSIFKREKTSFNLLEDHPGDYLKGEGLAEIKQKSEIKEDPKFIFIPGYIDNIKDVFPETHILDIHALAYSNFISPLNLKLQTNDVIWLLYLDNCDIWKQTKSSSELLKYLEDISASTEEGLNEIKLKSGTEPTIIVNSTDDEISTNVFSKSQIIDSHTFKYLTYISQINCKIQTNDIIWVLNNDNCEIWKKTKSSSKILKCLEDVDASTEEGFNEIKLKSGTEPTIVINVEKSEVFKTTSSNVLSYVDDILAFINAEGALIKAKIMAKDSNFINYDVDNLLEIPIDVKLNGKIIHSIKGDQSIPYKQMVNKLFKKVEEIETINAKKDKILETFYAKCKKVFLKLELDRNGISTVKFIPYFTITIFDTVLLLCNNKTKEILKFPASIDYGTTPFEFGIDYKSPTVIEYEKGNNLVKTKTVFDLNNTKLYYILNLNGDKQYIEETKFLADMFQEILKFITNEQSDDVSVAFTIPFYLCKEKKENYDKAISKAGFKNYRIQNEENALCDGFETEYNILDDNKYIFVHILGENGIIMSMEAPNICLESKIFDTNVLKKYKETWFENIVESADKKVIKSDERVKFSGQIEMIFEYIDKILNEEDNIDITIAVTCHRLLYTFIKDRFPDITNVIFIENPGILIVKNGVFGFGKDNDDDDNGNDDDDDEDEENTDEEDEEDNDNDKDDGGIIYKNDEYVPRV